MNYLLLVLPEPENPYNENNLPNQNDAYHARQIWDSSPERAQQEAIVLAIEYANRYVLPTKAIGFALSI